MLVRFDYENKKTDKSSIFAASSLLQYVVKKVHLKNPPKNKYKIFTTMFTAES